MEGENSNSSSDTMTYEDFCCLNNIPLCLKKRATAVPERTGEYSFVFLVLLRVPRMLSPVEGRSSNDSVLDETLHALVGTVESSSSIIADSFDSAVRDFDLSLLNQVSETPSGDALDSGVPASAGVRDSLKLRISEIEDQLGNFYLAVWRVSPRRAVREMTLLCQELFVPGPSINDFSVVRELDVRRGGVLLKVSSLNLKRAILENKAFFRLRGLSVDVA